jgi:hypothetical protein
VWGLCAGPITAIIVTAKFTPELQGFYYTFGPILALKTFVELGLGTVIVQFASHEWSRLSLNERGQIAGDPDALSRLASIVRFATKWYGVGALAVAVGLAFGGTVFFSSSATTGVEWFWPWLSLCVITSATLLLVPSLSLLEGCNQVGPLYGFRFLQGVIGSVSAWITILAGAGLWVASVSGIATLVCGLVFLRRRYGHFLKKLATVNRNGPRVDWRTEMWPMQWRIAVSWISGYFIFSLFVPVLFRFQGPVVAGQMGMTWGLVAVMGSIADSWLSPRAPVLGMLIAQEKYDELDRQFWRIAKTTVGVAALVALGLGCGVLLLNTIHVGIAQRLASRMLPPLPTGLLLLAQVIFMTASPFSTYLRAHKKEPLMVLSLVYAALVGCSTFFFGKNYSVTEVTWGYLILNAIMAPVVVLIWSRCRAKWHF